MKKGRDFRIGITTNRTYSWSFVTKLFRNSLRHDKTEIVLKVVLTP